jgi:hypothetical protein
MKETKTNPKKINTLEVNNYIINIYARPWMYEGSREVYAATITTPAGYQKGIVKWSGYLASTVQRAMEIAYE